MSTDQNGANEVILLLDTKIAELEAELTRLRNIRDFARMEFGKSCFAAAPKATAPPAKKRGRGNQRNHERDAAMMRDFKSGMRVGDIADKHNVALGTVYAAIKRVKRDAEPPGPTHEELREIDENIATLESEISDEDQAIRMKIRDAIADHPCMKMSIDDIVSAVGMGAARCLGEEEGRSPKDRMFERHGDLWSIAD